MQTDLTNFIEIQPQNIDKILELIKEFDGTQDDPDYSFSRGFSF